MNERRVQVPNGGLNATWERVVEEMRRHVNERRGPVPELHVARIALEAFCEWLVANPQVPTDEQIESMEFEPCSTTEWARQCVVEFQRRCLFAPAEPEDPLADLLLCPIGKPSAYGICGGEEANNRIREAFRRGQESMIRKDG